jgi:hypothetical protein
MGGFDSLGGFGDFFDALLSPITYNNKTCQKITISL